MPITVDPTPITVPAPPQTVEANRLHIDTLYIDARGEVANATNPPQASISTRLYAEDATGNRTYAADQRQFSTRDFYSACANVPEMAGAMAAVFTAVKAWDTYAAARKAELDAAQAELVTKQAAVTAAAASLQTARNNDAAGSTAQTQQAVTAADAALNTATLAEQAAQQAVATAEAAYDDPANPKLTTGASA